MAVAAVSFFLMPALVSAHGQIPQMVYPQDGEVLIKEEAYMFKVKPLENASGYLFDLVQNGVIVYENYRDTGQLSSNGEFILWDSDPAHANFRTGALQVAVRVLVEGDWTDPQILNLSLKTKGKEAVQSSTGSASQTISPEDLISSAATDSSALQKRVDELRKIREQSQQRKSVLELRLNQLIEWFKSLLGKDV